MKTWISSALNPKHRRLDALQARYDEALCDCTENLLVHLAQLEYCWCLYSAPLYTLQGHSLIPPHFPLISLAHTHTHGSLWRTSSIPNIPIGAWHQWRLARFSLCRPLQHLRPHIHHRLMLPSKGYHHVDGPCFSLPSSFIWISCTQTKDTVAITIILYNRTRFWSYLLTYL